MTYEKLETLSRIYNTLLLINTKGEDTLVMADCLNAMRAFVQNEQRELAVAMDTKATPEGVK